MYTDQDLQSLHDFLRATGEGNLKRMMVGGKMTETHLRILLKVARAGSAAEFATWAQSDGFPKIKMSPQEHEARETFWSIALQACANLGLLGQAPAKKAA